MARDADCCGGLGGPLSYVRRLGIYQKIIEERVYTALFSTFENGNETGSSIMRFFCLETTRIRC